MTGPDSIAKSSACAAVESALQSFLDGDSIDLIAATKEHCKHCASCRATVWAALELRRVLPRSSAPTVPNGFVDRLVAAVVAEPKTPKWPLRYSRLGWWVAVAASFVLAIGLIAARFWPAPERLPDQPRIEIVQTPSVEPLALRDRLADAGNAVVSLTLRAADQAVQPTRNLIPDAFDPMTLDVVGQFPKTIDPAAQSLQDVRQGAVSGLEPVAHSARRAFSMFLDMPPVDSDRKPEF